MTQIKAVLFDLDGVICDTAKYHYEAWKKLTDELNIYFDIKINERLKGVCRMDCMKIILENSIIQYSEDEMIAFATKKNNYYINLLEQLTSNDILPSINGIEAAIRAGMKSIGIGKKCLLNNANVIIPSTKELTIELVEKLCS